MTDHLDEPGDAEMDVALHRLKARKCERVQPDDEPGWKMYVTVDDKPALYCPECAAREFGGDDA